MIAGFQEPFIVWCLALHYCFSLLVCLPLFLLTLTTRLRWLWGSPIPASFTFLLFSFLALLLHVLEDFGYFQIIGIGGF